MSLQSVEAVSLGFSPAVIFAKNTGGGTQKSQGLSKPALKKAAKKAVKKAPARKKK